MASMHRLLLLWGGAYGRGIALRYALDACVETLAARELHLLAQTVAGHVDTALGYAEYVAYLMLVLAQHDEHAQQLLLVAY